MNDLSTLNVPGPTQIPLSEPFWEAATLGKLLIQHCTSCGNWVFYPRPICPCCWEDALEWREASGQARLKSFSTIWKPGHPGWLPVAPYVVGLVELVEGPTLLSYILMNEKDPKIGQALRFAPTNVGGRILPLFETH